jgi:hypothetical protein
LKSSHLLVIHLAFTYHCLAVANGASPTAVAACIAEMEAARKWPPLMNHRDAIYPHPDAHGQM